mmetsp:Transcript_12877/g.23133  ORF Transcript_12877/g.23133 Transcript_12877/m.23133 type:complete len:842 (+) Transcript_12877:128-2653(+)|eukprot:CAMPEP_0196143434 /NCGR_PEP_ID=MMETSP0910-20130528/13348_1 /TAXON_ID=49265 /ORGANISM="Thalassiosira rotula, Strain GSO102" /LENGTH=841 /DNA_ID=CAMNT_0041404891 /DNA_START=64 /DNA_END=2589 /DNA_ORIENTATION=-
MVKYLQRVLDLFMTTQINDVPTDTYQQTCELPPFEWAAYGTRVTGRMYTRRAALLGDSLYATGYLKSTGAPDKEDFEEVEDDFGVSGPFTSEDPTGTDAVQVVKDLVSYTTEHGSYAQYEVGVVKINVISGEPDDIFVYYGEGQDETAGLATKATSIGNVMAISGHFVGSLSADHSDGTTSTIYNSNTNGTADFVQHPNAIKNGFDDGFVISADADTGDAKWIIAHPKSNKDAQTVGVDVDTDGNIYGAGYVCNTEGADEAVICDGFVAKFDAGDGSIVWEQMFEDLGAAMWIAYDESDESLYVTGTTSYFGESSEGKVPKENTYCKHEICAVTMRLSADDGSTDWVRTTNGSPRWNFFDQSGDISLANDLDGPYIYVALDDVGEDVEGVISLDEGSSYAACSSDGKLTPEYEIDTTKLITADDCPEGSIFVKRGQDSGFSAANAATNAKCGQGHESVDACIIKYHKYTGLPIWGSNIHPVAALIPSVDGKSIMATGWYWANSKNSMGHHFDSVALPDYNSIEGVYNAKINTESGEGEYVMHSGGVGKTRVYDAVGNDKGDVFMVGYTQSAVIDWGGTLQTKIIEEGEDQNDDVGTAFQMGKVSSNTAEYQFFAVKLAAESPAPLSCVESCTLEGNSVAKSVIESESCLIDNVCYEEGDTAEIFGRTCLVCNPGMSQTEWSLADTVGELECFIDNVCYDMDSYYTFRESRSKIHTSSCQHCNPAMSSTEWYVDPVNFELNITSDGVVEPPYDCMDLTEENTTSTEPTNTVAAPSVPEPATPENKPASTSTDEPVTTVDEPVTSVDEPATSLKNKASNHACDESSLTSIAKLILSLVTVTFF